MLRFICFVILPLLAFGENDTDKNDTDKNESEMDTIRQTYALMDRTLFLQHVMLSFDFRVPYAMLMNSGHREVEFKYAKYLVSIRTVHPMQYFGDNHFCTGTVAGSHLILTAAHCVVDATKTVIRARRLVVVAAAPNRIRRDKTTVELAVQQVITHNKYQRYGRNDIAILRLKDPVPRDNDAVAILGLTTETTNGTVRCVAVGWSPMYTDGPISANTWYQKMDIVDGSACRRLFPTTYRPNMICAENTDDVDGDVCRVDLGGALICNHILVGIVSWGQRCSAGRPVVFTNIAEYRDWIEMANMTVRICTLLKLQFYVLTIGVITLLW